MQGNPHDRWREVESLRMPTLWIRGENSQDLSHESFEKILRSNQMIRGVEIPGAGHWVHSDQPGLFLLALQEFVGGF
jgi:pimeloyl-ACP methyl ester carboxylesterase